MSAAAATMTEEQAVTFLRNTLLVAGHEIGKVGDHWPAIKSTIHRIMQDWQVYQEHRKANEQMRKEYGDLINQMETDVKQYPSNCRPEAEKILKEIRELYEARFSPIDLTMFVVCDEDTPIHIRRAEAVMKTLEDEDG